MSEEEAFVCPVCGGPYRALIPVGVVQVECPYCKATVLVPPQLGREVQRCPNHPDILAVGLCNDCRKSYCDRCLYVYDIKGGRLHLCHKCYQESKDQIAVAIVLLVLELYTIGSLVVLLALPEIVQPDLAFWIVPLLVGGFFVLILVLLRMKWMYRPTSVHDSRQPQNN